MMRRSLVLLIAAVMAVTLKIQLPEVSAAANTESVAGLYIGKSTAASGPYKIHGRYFQDHYEYLFPDGTFYTGLIMQGYDDLNLAEYLSFQHPLRVEQDTGRYVVDGDQVTFLKAGGKKTTLTLRGNTFGSGDNKLVRQPNYDGLTLSGTYEMHDIRNIGITFTPDGRFVDHGAMPWILHLTDSRLDSPARTLRPGPGTYSIKNYTITLRYAHGPVFRLFFYVHSDDRGKIDSSTITIYMYKLFRQGGSPADQTSTPAVRLPKIEASTSWKSQYDPSGKRTNVVPPDLPKGRAVQVIVYDPEPLADRSASQFPVRFHDAVAQEIAKRYSSQGMRTEKAMTRQDVGKVPFSTGVFGGGPDGKTWWVTVFTLVSATEGQVIAFFSDGEDFHKAYLPTVQAMLGDGDPSPPVRTTNLAPPLSGGFPKIENPRSWKSEYREKDQVTEFVPPNLPPGRIVKLLVSDRVTFSDPEEARMSPEEFHQQLVKHAMDGFIKAGARPKAAMQREEAENILSSTGELEHKDGKSLWMTASSIKTNTKGQYVLLMSDDEDLHRRYLPTVKGMFGDNK